MKAIVILLFACISFSVSAQGKFQLVDNFDSNQNGWTEAISKKSKAIIQNGVLFLDSKDKNGYAESFAFLGVSLKENFELNCQASINVISKDNYVGLIFNGENDNNLCAFLIGENVACLYEKRNGSWNLISSERIKLSNKKNQTINLGIKNSFGVLTFYVNGMEAIGNITGRINYSGFGFVISGKQTAKFDNLEITQ